MDIWINSILLSKKSECGRRVHTLSLEKVKVSGKRYFEIKSKNGFNKTEIELM